MGILNVTPDSFSDGGSFCDPGAALAHADHLIATGATIIDVGGESTRPGATPVDPDTEWARISPVITGLVDRGGVTISVDTYHAETARRAADAGAHIINDVTGGRVDPDMLSVVAKTGLDYVLQHSRGPASSTNEQARYTDIAREVRRELADQLARATGAGICRDRIILDPGLGFSKVGTQDWEVLAQLEQIASLGGRFLVGHSRKRFLPADKDVATAIVSALLAGSVWAVRVHNVELTALAISIAERMGHG